MTEKKERRFKPQNEEIDFDLLPVFPVKQLSRMPSEADWRKLPKICSFRAPLTDDAAPAAEFSAQFAAAEGRIYLHVECVTYAAGRTSMRAAYKDWCFDNSIEFFIGNSNIIHQFLLNAEGANVRFVNRHVAPPVPGCQTSGHNEPGRWSVDFSGDISELIPDGEAAFKVMAVDVDTILGAQYYSMLNNGFDGYGLLRLGDGTPHEVFSGADIKAPDWGMLRRMVLSACRLRNVSMGDLTDPGAVRGALHDVMEHLKPERGQHPTVDFRRKSGMIRPIYGVNYGPKITTQANYDWNDSWRKLGAASMRVHDAALSEPGSRLVDTIFVFPLEDADPGDPRNYYFDQTDYYFSNTMEQGAEIYYRLGVSIDHGKKRFTAHAPKDFARYAEVCAGIVRHYNHGWANGHFWKIRYWEVWNEPESPLMWDRSFDDYLELFVTVYKRLKREFPEIKVGGFGAMSLNIPLFRKLAEKCRLNGIQPDFISWHHYSSNLEGMSFQPYAARFMADSLGLDSAELHLTEWHYVNLGPGTEAGCRDMGGIDSAAFTAGVISAWQDSPLDLSHFYTAGIGPTYGVFGLYGERKKVYHALCACGLFQTRFKQRVYTLQGNAGTTLLAACDDDGCGAILYSCFKTSETRITIRIPGLSEQVHTECRILDETHDFTPVSYCRNGDVLEFSKLPGSAVFLICIPRFQPA